MKRIGRHVLFWTGYTAQQVLLIYYVNAGRVQLPAGRAVTLALAHSLLLLVPKLLFTYFLLAHPPQRDGRRLGPLLAALAGTLVLYRALLCYGIEPYVYHWKSGLSFAAPLGLLVALMDVGFVAGVALALRQARLQRLLLQRQESLQREKLEAELRFLRSQTNPHFLFNTLNNIYALARKGAPQTPDAVLRLSKLMRFLLQESARPSITIADELRLLDDYIGLEQLRYSDRLRVTSQRSVDNEQESIAPLLLLPLVENAFKHGPGESFHDAFIRLDLTLRERQLQFVVENSTEVPVPESEPEGIGLPNLRRQLALLYPGSRLAVERLPGRFRVSLFLDLTTHEKDLLPAARR